MSKRIKVFVAILVCLTSGLLIVSREPSLHLIGIAVGVAYLLTRTVQGAMKGVRKYREAHR